uniref:Uncharacterized protein n=1 Tax=Tetranychus urticae TaxID=32264 RepID=T1KV40_TETUR
MDSDEQSNPIESLDQSELDIDQFVTKLSSTKKKVESIAEKVSWSSAGALVDTENAHTFAAESACSSSKWLSSQKITERFSDNVILTDDDSLVVVCNRSARRMQTHSESIVTRKVRSQIIEMDDEGNDCEEGDFFEEEQLISAPTKSNEDTTLDTSTTKANFEATDLESTQQVKQASIDVSSTAWLNETKKLTSSCWSSQAMESFESVESCIEESEVGQELQDENQQGNVDSI